jgi:tetratricopeptide (TPR) repeat protein
MRILLGGLLTVLLASPSPAQSFSDLVRDARIAMHTGRAEEAVTLFDSAGLAFDRGWAHVEIAWFKTQVGDYLAADAACAQAAKVCPDLAPRIRDLRLFARNSFFRTEFRSALVRRGVDWDKAVSFASETLTLDPDSIESHYNLALACDRRRKYDDARKHFAFVVGIKPDRRQYYYAVSDAAFEIIRRRRISAERPVHPVISASDDGDWQRLSHGRILIRHHSKAMAQLVFDSLQYYMNQPLAAGLLPAVRDLGVPCEVFIFRNQAEYLAATNQPAWSAGCCNRLFHNGRLAAVRLYVFQNLPDLLESTLPHELAHARFGAKPWHQDSVPAWIEEGVAESAEPLSCDLPRLRLLREGLQRNILLDASKVMAAREVPSGKDTGVFYVESWAMVNVLAARSGSDRFDVFANALKTRDPAKCLQAGYGLTFLQLEDLVIDFMHQNAPREAVAPAQDPNAVDSSGPSSSDSTGASPSGSAEPSPSSPGSPAGRR